jgi:hypothetical protein
LFLINQWKKKSVYFGNATEIVIRPEERHRCREWKREGKKLPVIIVMKVRQYRAFSFECISMSSPSSYVELHAILTVLSAYITAEHLGQKSGLVIVFDKLSASMKAKGLRVLAFN